MKSKILYVVGSGQQPKKHMTLEAVSVCRDAEKLLTICGNATDVLEAIGGHDNHEDIIDLYIDGSIDNDNYNRIINKILTECDRYETVSVTTAGHPLFGVSWWKRLKKNRRLNSTVQYIEGISSLTSMFVELEADPLETGSIIIDANRCLIFEYDITPELDLYIFNICSTGTRNTNITNPAKGNRLSDLKEHLLKYYSGGTTVKMVSAEHSGMPPRIIQVQLEDLEELLQNINFYSSLFIPATMPKQYNRDFIRNLLEI
jgi:uncharacterized protein YabN with tetrapyrrole methylase and pyrophosphatase domain